jgi:hypothetical protein
MLANLKAALAARRMRQIDLALLLRVPPSVLSEVVNERRKAGSQLREAIAGILQADSAWLFAPVTHIPAPSQPLAGDPVNVIPTYEGNGGAGSDAMAERPEKKGESRQ